MNIRKKTFGDQIFLHQYLSTSLWQSKVIHITKQKGPSLIRIFMFFIGHSRKSNPQVRRESCRGGICLFLFAIHIALGKQKRNPHRQHNKIPNCRQLNGIPKFHKFGILEVLSQNSRRKAFPKSPMEGIHKASKGTPSLHYEKKSPKFV